MQKISDVFVSVNGRRLELSDAPVSDFPHSVRVCPDRIDETYIQVDTPVFSADALSAAVYAAAEQNSLQERSVLMAQSSCCSAVIPAVVEPKERKVTLVLPVPHTLQENGCLRVAFPGITCIVAQTALSDPEMTGPALLVLRDPECEMLQIRYLGADGQQTELVSSGLAAVAAAIDQAQTLADGVIEYGVGMPGGTAEVGISKKQGQVAGVSICSMLQHN